MAAVGAGWPQMAANGFLGDLRPNPADLQIYVVFWGILADWLQILQIFPFWGFSSRCEPKSCRFADLRSRVGGGTGFYSGHGWVGGGARISRFQDFRQGWVVGLQPEIRNPGAPT